MNDEINHGDALCFVLAPRRSASVVYQVLNEFLPGYQKVAGDYPFNLMNDRAFETEEAILAYLENNKRESGTIYWDKNDSNPDRIMVGAYFTSDAYLIMSLTIRGGGGKEDDYFKRLKATIDSAIGVIYYNQFPDFKDGNDFKTQFS